MQFNYGTNPLSGRTLFSNRKRKVGGVFGFFEKDQYAYIETEIIRNLKSTEDVFYIAGDIRQFSANFIDEVKDNLSVVVNMNQLSRGKRINVISIISQSYHLLELKDLMTLSIERMTSLCNKNEKAGKHTYIYVFEIDSLFQNDIAAKTFIELVAAARMLGWTFMYTANNVRPFSESVYGKGLLAITNFLALLQLDYASRCIFQRYYDIPDNLMKYMEFIEEEHSCTGLVKKDTGLPFEAFRY